MTSTVRPPRRDATENRAALLGAARIELNRDAGASLEAIAARAGLSRRAVYGHFATRDELLRELITVGAGRIATSVATVEHPDPVVRLALIASRLWREVDEIRVMAVFAVRGPLRTQVGAALAPLRQRVTDAIAEGATAGSVRRDIPVPRLARLVEDSALSALTEASRGSMPAPEAHRMTMLLVLATLGLGAAESAALIDSHPELAWRDR